MSSQEKMQAAVQKAVDCVMFENWVRFYFLEESGSTDEDGEPVYVIAIPEKSIAALRQDYEDLAELAGSMNGREANFETSRNAVCSYLVSELDGADGEDALSVVESFEFQLAATLLSVWVQRNERVLDMGLKDFPYWKAHFEQWRASEQGADAEKELLEQCASEVAQ